MAEKNGKTRNTAKASANNKKNNKKVRSFFKLLGAVFLISGIVVSFIGAGIISSCLIEAFNFNPEDYNVARTSTIYYTDSSGHTSVYETVNSPSNRRWIRYDKIPADMKNAAIAIEDERFYSHNGVDIKRTLGAVLGYITGSDGYGGSTITQQVVKNITKDEERKALRKVREIFRAIKLESEYSKDEILELYLNVSFFGSGNGVQSASHAYFGKDVSELNLAECASIVGITKYPTKYNPLTNPENNKERQETVLYKMHELEMISDEEYQEALDYQLVFTPDKEENIARQSYFTELVIGEVFDDLVNEGGYSESLAESMIYNGGLTIYSTVDPKVQSAMEKVLENRSNFTSSSSVQAAMVVMDPYTGQVKGSVGGAGVKDRDLGLNRAVDAYRQPGSTIKPLAVYGPAMEEGFIYGPGSTVVDKPIDINGYKPGNWYSGYKGTTTVRNAIIWSMNTPAVQTVDEMGVNVSLSYLKNKYHISTIDEKDGLAAVSLGGLTNGVNVLEWTAAYCTFPNDGEWISPCSYTKVVDHSGKVILEKKQIREKVFSERTNFLMTDILKSTASSSLIGGAISGMSCAGKTGTTNSYVDKWYMGFTPYYTGGVWVGNDDSSPLNNGATSNSPQRIWRAVMSEIHKGLEDTGFSPAPSGIKKVSLCSITGKLASETCPKTYEYVNTNTIKYCSGNHPVPEKEENSEDTEGETSEGETSEGEAGEGEAGGNTTSPGHSESSSPTGNNSGTATPAPPDVNNTTSPEE